MIALKEKEDGDGLDARWLVAASCQLPTSELLGPCKTAALIKYTFV
jgi:hypothetical protein